jgi:hypothetical protein
MQNPPFTGGSFIAVLPLWTKKGPETLWVLRTNGGNRGCVASLYANTGTDAIEKDRIWLFFYGFKSI